MVVLRYVILPLVVFGIGGCLLWQAAWRYPGYVGGVAAIGFVMLCVRVQLHKKRDRLRGWRVGHAGRDSMYYEEFRADAWHRIEIDGGMLVDGKAHHVIYFGSLKFPDWAKERREEILARIKSEFHSPHYEYE